MDNAAALEMVNYNIATAHTQEELALAVLKREVLQDTQDE